MFRKVCEALVTALIRFWARFDDVSIKLKYIEHPADEEARFFFNSEDFVEHLNTAVDIATSAIVWLVRENYEGRELQDEMIERAMHNGAEMVVLERKRGNDDSNI